MDSEGVRLVHCDAGGSISSKCLDLEGVRHKVHRLHCELYDQSHQPHAAGNGHWTQHRIANRAVKVLNSELNFAFSAAHSPNFFKSTGEDPRAAKISRASSVHFDDLMS